MGARISQLNVHTHKKIHTYGRTNNGGAHSAIKCTHTYVSTYLWTCKKMQAHISRLNVHTHMKTHTTDTWKMENHISHLKVHTHMKTHTYRHLKYGGARFATERTHAHTRI